MLYAQIGCEQFLTKARSQIQEVAIVVDRCEQQSATYRAYGTSYDVSNKALANCSLALGQILCPDRIDPSVETANKLSKELNDLNLSANSITTQGVHGTKLHDDLRGATCKPSLCRYMPWGQLYTQLLTRNMFPYVPLQSAFLNLYRSHL